MNRRVVAYTNDNGGEEPRGSDARARLALCPNPVQSLGHVPVPPSSDVGARISATHASDVEGNNGGGGEQYPLCLWDTTTMLVQDGRSVLGRTCCVPRSPLGDSKRDQTNPTGNNAGWSTATALVLWLSDAASRDSAAHTHFTSSRLSLVVRISEMSVWPRTHQSRLESLCSTGGASPLVSMKRSPKNLGR